MKEKILNSIESDKNCGKCTWSERSPTDLILKCTLEKKIENTWITAQNCNYYIDVQLKKRKKTIIQLNLFQQT